RLPSIVVAHPRMRESDAEQRRYSLPLLFTPVRRLLRHALTPLARRLGARGGRSTISVFTGCTSASDHRDLDREERSPRRGGSRDASSPQPLRRGFHQLLQLAATSSPSAVLAGQLGDLARGHGRGELPASPSCPRPLPRIVRRFEPP